MSDIKHVSRLSGDERREAILQAVKAVFAKNGFDGTTTKDLAKAAGVSEALIFRHFPDKESLFEAMCESCYKGLNEPHVQEIMALEASTSTLIILTHFLVSKILHGTSEDDAIIRLMTWSLLKDGDFARFKLKSFSELFLPKFEECLKAAEKAGDLSEVPIRRDLRVWFMNQIAFVTAAYHMPEKPPLNYRASKEALQEQVTWFALLGMGIKQEVIKQHYHPKALSLLAK